MINTKPIQLSPKNLDIWNDVSQRLYSAPEVELFLDYDGTLTQIRNTPSEALAAPTTLQLLQKLTHLFQTQVTIVTGRSMEEIRKFISLANIQFIANHGFHVFQNGTEWVHPNALAASPKLHRLGEFLQNVLHEYPKAFVEDKQFTLSVHYRNVSAPDIPSVRNSARAVISSFDPAFIITEGKEVLEVRPPVDWGKGSAVLEILNKSRPQALPVYIGDDKTDESAFQVLQSSGITIHVGEVLETYAQYYVHDVDEVLQILKVIVKLRSRQSGQDGAS